MDLETICKDEKVSAQLSREGIKYLVGEKYFVVWDTKTDKMVEFIPYDRVQVLASSSQSASVFFDGISEMSIDEVSIVIQPQEKVIHIAKREYEKEFESFLSQLQLKVIETKQQQQ